MNKIVKEEKICCLLFQCPMIEEIKSCAISNLRLVNYNQPFIVEERIETIYNKVLLSPKFLCINSNAE